MATTSDIRNGLCIRYKDSLWQVIEFLHVKPGKGPAFVRTKLRNLENGKVVDNTFNAGIKMDVVRIETRNYQFIFKDDMGYHFMNSETFEQVRVDEHLINAPQFLKDGLECKLLFHAEEETILNAELPQYVEAEVTYTEPGVKGDTATNTMKPATLDCGVEVRVPLFINTGDWVKVATADGSYSERLKM